VGRCGNRRRKMPLERIPRGSVVVGRIEISNEEKQNIRKMLFDRGELSLLPWTNICLRSNCSVFFLSASTAAAEAFLLLGDFPSDFSPTLEVSAYGMSALHSIKHSMCAP